MVNIFDYLNTLFTFMVDFLIDLTVYIISMIFSFAEGDYVSKPFLVTFTIILAVSVYILVNKVTRGSYT